MTNIPQSAHDYARQYSGDFVDRWDDLIDWDRRRQGEGLFFIELLRKMNAKKIIDVSTGSGFHAVSLKMAGFEVYASDGSPDMVARARKNFASHAVEIPSVVCDWAELTLALWGQFDAVLCLGSSLCHVFAKGSRIQALRNFNALLRPGGLLIVDQRNFDAIRAGKYSSSGNFYYCGKSASLSFGEIRDDYCEFIFTFADNAVHRVEVYPLRHKELQDEISAADFNYLKRYGDFQEEFNAQDCDFIIHTATK